MGYHPETLVGSFPPYPSHKKGLAKAVHALKPWIGFDIWHIDPERRREGQRTDDSCGWFDRTPGAYADAVTYLQADEEFMFELNFCVSTRAPVEGAYGHVFPRMRLEVTLAACLLAAQQLELRRWWNGQNGKPGLANRTRWPWSPKQRCVDGVAYDLALTPYDNLASVDNAEILLHLVAAALNRRFRPRWRHPRWHVHHWQINFDLARNVRRMFERCATCHKGLGFGYCPVADGDGMHHLECRGISFGQASGNPR